MAFVAGMIAGAAAVALGVRVFWLITGNRRRQPVLRPSMTAGLEGLNAFPEPLALTEGDKIVFVNKAFGREINELAAGRAWPEWLDCLTPDSRMATPQAPPMSAQATGLRAESQLRTQSGRVLTWTAVPFPGMGRKLVLNIVRDVTASQGRNVDQALFMNKAAHELKTPVTAIKGYAELMQMYAASGRPVSADIADRIVHQTNRLVHLVNQLLDVARLGANRLSDVPETVSFREALDQVLDRLRGLYPDRALRADFQVGGQILIDPLRLEQIVRELVLNAIQYSPPGQPVDVKAYLEHDTAFVEVTDHGIGIPSNEIGQVLGRFVRGSNVGEMPGQGGFGLGLFIAHEILERWHGELRLMSAPGQGTTAVASWPIRRAPYRHEQTPAAASAEPPAELREAQTESKR